MPTTASPAASPSPQPLLRSYAYEAQTPDGQALRGTLEAHSVNELHARLSALHLHVLVIDEQSATPPARKPPLGRDDFLLFNHQLAHLSQAGLPVERSLRLIAADLRKGRLASAVNDVASDLERGTPLPEAFSRHASRFPTLYGQLIEAGARSGNLPGMLFNLGRHLELVSRLRESLWRTISYPIMVLSAAALVLLFVSFYVVPRFAEMYTDFKIDPPFLTRTLIAFGVIYPWFLAGVVALILLALILIRLLNAGKNRSLRDSLFLNLPLIGPILRANLLARWIDALRISVESGLDLPRAIRLASEATAASGPFHAETLALADALSRGEPLSRVSTRLIPPTITAAIDLASAGPDLSTALITLSHMYEQQAEHRLRALPSIITPVLMLFVGGCIGWCMMALFLPLVQQINRLTSSVGY